MDDEDQEPEEQEVDGDEGAKLTAEAIKLGKEDPMFDRVRIILENLLTTGKEALAVKIEDLAPRKGTKVLHEEEARTWRGDSGSLTPAGTDNINIAAEGNGSSSSSDYGEEILSRTYSQSFGDSMNSEREVEELVGNLRASLSTSLQA